MKKFQNFLCEKKIVMNDNIARAAGWDAGNRNAKKHGRTTWNEDDYNVAVETYNKLMGYEDDK